MFWIGFMTGLVIGNITAVTILLFFTGASERMTYEEWEAHDLFQIPHA